MSTLLEKGICIAIAGGITYGIHKLGWLPTSKKEDAKDQTSAQKEMQNITMKPQVQMDSFVRQPQSA